MCNYPPMAWRWCITIFASITGLTRENGAWLTGETPRIKDLSFAELQRFDLGRADPASDYAQDHPLLRPEDGARIPSLGGSCGAGAPILSPVRGTEIAPAIRTAPIPSPWRMRRWR